MRPVASDRGFDVYGVELSDWVAAFAREKKIECLHWLIGKCKIASRII